MKQWLNYILAFFVLFFAYTANAQQTIAPYTAQDVLKFTRVARVLPSPDGKAVAYVTYTAQPASDDKKRYTLFIKNILKQTKLLVRDVKIDAISFSADGSRIAYLAPGKRFKSLWTVDVKSKQKNKLYEFTQDISLFKWSPNGKYIAFLATESSLSPKPTQIIDVSKDYKNSQLYLLSLSKNAAAKPITTNHFNVTDFTWSPDNLNIAFSFQPRAGAAYNNENKINVINLQTQKTQPVSYTEAHSGVQPQYSPDGKWLAFASNLMPSAVAQPLNNDVVLNDQICITDTSALTTRCLANTFNQNPFILGWNATSDQVLVLDAFKSVGYYIYALSIDKSQPAKTISNIEGFIEPLTVTLNQNHTMFGFGYETTTKAPEVFTSLVAPFQLTQQTHMNEKIQLSSLGKVKTISWQSTDGMNIEGLLLIPQNYDRRQKYPLYVAVHGGPAGAWGKRYLGGCDEYGAMIEPTSCWQNLISLGFVVFAPNPRGSSGYGLAFRLANFADFGGGDYRDIMTGIDYLIQQGIAEPKHLAIGGWSFGGYMTAWAISQTQRFKVAVEGDGNTDFISFSGTSDIPTYYERNLGTPFWLNDTLYLERAPIMHVNNIHTPLLIMHGENDVRVPLTQSYELYTALQRQNKPVRMLVFPKEAHVPTNANIIAASINEVDAWLKQALI